MPNPISFSFWVWTEHSLRDFIIRTFKVWSFEIRIELLSFGILEITLGLLICPGDFWVPNIKPQHYYDLTTSFVLRKIDKILFNQKIILASKLILLFNFFIFDVKKNVEKTFYLKLSHQKRWWSLYSLHYHK